jgi:hypothetical protein
MIWWWKRRLNKTADEHYGVFLHVRNLSLIDSAGIRRVGGAYTWRYVTAKDVESATKAAIESLLTAPAFVDEVPNPRDALKDVSVEKVVLVRQQGKRRGTGVVFYIDTEDV